MFGQMMDQPLLISSQISFAERFHADVEVVTRTVEGPIHRSTWGEVARRSRRLANALLKMGVREGDRVATIAWNTQRHLELYFAVSGLGAILHTINPRLSPEQLAYVVDHAADEWVFFDTTFVKLAEILAARPKSTVRGFVAMTDEAHRPASSIEGLLVHDTLLEAESDALVWPTFDERTASSLCYTSGTSGHPKGVVYSHRSTVLHSYAVTMTDTLALSAADVTLPVVPMFHVNAWGVPYACAMVGSKLVLPGPGLDGKSLTELVEAEGVTSLLGVPTVWANLLAHLASEGKKLGTVKKVVIGGSACPGTMIEAFEKGHNARVIHAWGMTETSPVGTVNVMLPEHEGMPWSEVLSYKLKQGRPMYGVDLRIVDDEGTELPRDGKASGHLQIRGPWVASGYFRQEGSDTHHDGWFATGDIATLDARGTMQITDRSKDVIKSGGEWISSIDLENAALACPGVQTAAAFGLPHPKWQERPMLVVVRAPGTELTANEVMSFLAGRMPRWWLPDAIEFVEALPIGPTGKVLKRTLRERFAGYVFST
ncbi:MAG: long-chain-fatty-acid--CoA ligase [Alphaproteobacteria bacterium]|nr:long-chain-fatty-acid--CoA ligase [Alphaproteobacteria bacterium]